MRKVKSISLNLIFSGLVLLLFSPLALAEEIKVVPMKGISGTAYRLYQTNGLSMAWQIKRPSKKNTRIKLCLPAAFTTKSDTVVGIYAIKGKIANRKAISKPIGGAILIENGSFKIFPNRKGAVFTSSFLAGVKKRKATFFQQFQIVTNGVPARFKDKKHYQMRAIVRFKDNREGVVESDKEITFKTFNKDLAAIGVKNALYTDMGAWDEGWYRDPINARIVTIGNDRSKTDKQSNWVTFLDN